MLRVSSSGWRAVNRIRSNVYEILEKDFFLYIIQIEVSYPIYLFFFLHFFL